MGNCPDALRREELADLGELIAVGVLSWGLAWRREVLLAAEALASSNDTMMMLIILKVKALMTNIINV